MSTRILKMALPVVVTGSFLFSLTGLACRAEDDALQGASDVRDSLMADIVYTNGKVVTLDSQNTLADSIATKGDKIVGVGNWTPNDIRQISGRQTKVYDLEGRTIIPGLQESHIHFTSLGADTYYIARFDEAGSIADIQQLLRDLLAKLQRDGNLDVWTYPATGETGPWLFGSGWNQDKLAEHRMATREELDAVSRDVPITLSRIYRGTAVNTKVFELKGYYFDKPETWPEWFKKDPAEFGPGDIIDRDPQTNLPTGVFFGAATRLVGGVAPRRSFEQDVESIHLGAKEVLTKGITSIIDPGVQTGNKAYQAAYNRGLLPIRVTTYDGIWHTETPEEMEERLRPYGVNNIGDTHYRIRGLKVYADGGAGSRSAAVSVPFEPIPSDPLGSNNYGSLVEPDFDKRLAMFRMAAVNYGWELHTHSIGDVAIRQTTDAYKILMDEIKANNPTADLRWSIIHVYMPDEPETSVIKDMADYGIIACINPGDIYVEGDSFLQNLGPERLARLMPFKTFLDNGIVVASGSDYSVAPWDPWIGIYAMRTRELQVSKKVVGPEQCISLEDALKTYTINGAYLTYDEDIRGSLEAGKLADLVVIDADLLEVPDSELLQMGSRVGITMVGGNVEYQKDGFSLPEIAVN